MAAQGPSPRTIARVFLTVVGPAVALFLLWQVRNVVLLLPIAVFLSGALGPAVDHAQRLKVPRGVAILLTFLFLFLVVFVVGSLVVPPIVDQVENFVANVPSYIQDIRANGTLRRYDDQ